jgi:hypothetical protein
MCWSLSARIVRSPSGVTSVMVKHWDTLTG